MLVLVEQVCLSPIFFKKTMREYKFIHFDHERIFWNFKSGGTLYASQEDT